VTSTTDQPPPDVPEILALIRELASFEKAPDRVEATEALLLQTLSFAPFDASTPDRGYARTFLLTYPASSSNLKETVGGMALYFHNYSTWLATPGIYLEDLFVRPEYRRKGNATRLLRRLAQEAKEVSGGRGRLEWSCLKWNTEALDFYRGIGGVTQDEWIGVRVEGEGLVKMAEGGGGK